MEAGYRRGLRSDLGHEGPITDSSFSLGHPELLVDWGHRATHVMAEQAKKAIKAFYGKAQSFSYYAGCSGGGRQAMMEAQRYPDDYDGILAGDPIMNFTRLTIAGRLWAQLAMYREGDGAGYIPATKIPAIAAAVVAACDKLDGVADGIIHRSAQVPLRPGQHPVQRRATSPGLPDRATRSPRSGKDLRRARTTARASRSSAAIRRAANSDRAAGRQYLSGDGPYKGGQWNYARGVLPVLLYGDPSWDMVQQDRL